MPPKIQYDPTDLSLLRGLSDLALQAPRPLPMDRQLLSRIVAALLSRIRRLRPDEAKVARMLIRCLAMAEYQGVVDNHPQLLLSPRKLITLIRNGELPVGKHWTQTVIAQRLKLIGYFMDMDNRGYARDSKNEEMKPDPFPLGRKMGTEQARAQWLKRHEQMILRLLNIPCHCDGQRSFVAITDETRDPERWIGNCKAKESAIVRIISEWHGLQDSSIRDLISPENRRRPTRRH